MLCCAFWLLEWSSYKSCTCVYIAGMWDTRLWEAGRDHLDIGELWDSNRHSHCRGYSRSQPWRISWAHHLWGCTLLLLHCYISYFAGCLSRVVIENQVLGLFFFFLKKKKKKKEGIEYGFWKPSGCISLHWSSQYMYIYLYTLNHVIVTVVISWLLVECCPAQSDPPENSQYAAAK